MAMQQQQHHVQYAFTQPVHPHQQHQQLPQMHQYHPQQHQLHHPPASGTVAPADTYNQPTPSTSTPPQHPPTPSTPAAQPPAAPSNNTPLIAQGDWTKNLVHLAKTAELKKHALTLQLHTAHIMSAHTALDAKNKAKQDILEQKNKLESERAQLLKSLQSVNADRDKADLMEAAVDKECTELRVKIQTITDGDYAASKNQVDTLRAELGMPPLPTLQQTLEEKSAAYLNDRRLNSIASASSSVTPTNSTAVLASGAANTGTKRSVSDVVQEGTVSSPGKRPRGRPKGSKNRAKQSTSVTAPGGEGASASENALVQ